MNHKAESNQNTGTEADWNWEKEGNNPSSVCLNLELHSFSYGETGILGELNLSVSKNETVALTGPSGIGKTTLLRIIAGLETGFIGKRNCTSRIGMVFQEPTLLPWRTAISNICLAADIDEESSLSALIEVGLEGKENSFPGQLSLGQQRRLSLARAFAIEPDILLLDEPFVSLDTALVKEMMELFMTLKKRRSLATIFVSHAQSEVEMLASRSLTLGGNPARIVEQKKFTP